MKRIGKGLIIVSIAVLLASLCACGSSKPSTASLEWPSSGLATMLPEPTTLQGEIVTDSENTFTVEISKTTEDEYKEYVKACQDKGFTIDADEGSSTFEAYNEEGYEVDLYYYSDDNYYRVRLYAPRYEEGETYTWPTSKLAQMVPEPDSNIGRIEVETSEAFDIYVGDSSLDDYNNYVDECIAAGFDVDYYRSEEYFKAENEVGVSLSVSYEGFNTFFLDVHAYNVDLENVDAEEDVIEEETDEKTEDTSVSDNIEDKTTSSDDTSKENAGESEDKSSRNSSNSNSSNLVGVSDEVKDALDSFEAFVDDYVAFMEKYENSSDTTSMIADYTNYLQEYSEMMEKIDALGDSNLNAAETKYYAEVTARCSKKILDTIGD